MTILDLFHYLQHNKTVMGYSMSIDRLFNLQQTTATEFADKMLGANFLSLALVAIIMVVAMFLLFVWMNMRREAAEARRQDAYDKRQDAFLKTVIGEDSPLVQAQRNTAAILEKSEKRAEERTSALQTLVHQTTEQTAELSRQTSVIELQGKDLREYQVLVSDNLHAQTESIDGLRRDIAQHFADIDAKLDQLINGRDDCAGFKTDWDAFRSEMRSLLQRPVDAVSTVTVNTSTPPAASNVIEDSAKPASGVAAA